MRGGEVRVVLPDLDLLVPELARPAGDVGERAERVRRRVDGVELTAEEERHVAPDVDDDRDEREHEDAERQLARPEQPLAAQEELPAIEYAPEAEEVGEVPITDELQPWLKWLSSAGLDGPAGEPDRADQ